MLFLAAVLASPASAGVTVELTTGHEPRVEVVGLSAETLAELAGTKLDREAWQRILALYVDTGNKRPALPVLGDYRVQDGRVIFTPQFPLRPGLSYRAVLETTAIPGAQARQQRVETLLEIPAAVSSEAPAAMVTAVYPSSDALPENLLKFYIHFSAPMRRGEIYRYIQLMDDTGKPVDAPFLELAEELWDGSVTRLTLLLDPGRVKQELKPHKEVGRALVAGSQYTLSIAKKWPDARGAPLANDYHKRFRVAKADVRQPDPKQWRLAVPPEETREPLVVRFDEPLDQALLEHSIRVLGPAGDALKGRVAVGKHERHMHFVPDRPWDAGSYRLVIDATLEDLAGNSIGRPFEVHLPSGRPSEMEQFVVPFTVGNISTDAEVRRPSSNER